MSRTKPCLVVPSLLIVLWIFAFPAGVLAAVDDDPVIRFIYVGFPETQGGPVTDQLPPWVDDLATDLSTYLGHVSNGIHIADTQVLRRPGDPSAVWPANQPNEHYYYNRDELEAEMIEFIAEEYLFETGQDIWSGVEVLIIFNLEWIHPTLIGWGGLAMDPATRTQLEEAYDFSTSAHGSVMMLVSSEVTESELPKRIEGITVHEYGHILHGPHIAGSHGAGTYCEEVAPNNLEWVNYGHYAALKGPGGVPQDPIANPPDPPVGFVSWHPMNLIARGWLTVEEVFPTETTQSFVVSNVRDPVLGKALKINVPGTSQYFLVVNHQQTDPYDEVYGGSGLLLWHIWDNKAWDLESAAGKRKKPPFLSGPTNPDTWWDPLEEDVCHPGSAEDFWDGTLAQGNGPDRTRFAPDTNPNTNLYSMEACTYQVQDVYSGIHIENIEPVPGSTDFSLEVRYVPPPPEEYITITLPWADNVHSAGEEMTVNWTYDTGSTVDIFLLESGGTYFEILAVDTPNDGEFVFNLPPDIPAGESYVIRVADYPYPIISGDPGPTPISTDSGPFTIWELTNLQAIELSQSCPGPTITFRMTWDTSTSNGKAKRDTVKVYQPGQTNATVATLLPWGDGTDHAVDVTAECAVGNWTYVVSSTREGVPARPCFSLIPRFTTVVSPPQTIYVASCDNCNPGHCPPDCSEIESVGNGIIPKTTFLRAGFPNPFISSARVSFGLHEETRVELEVFGISGRRVASLASGSLPPGEYAMTWSGEDEGGRPVPAGVYFIRLVAGKERFSRKILRIR